MPTLHDSPRDRLNRAREERIAALAALESLDAQLASLEATAELKADLRRKATDRLENAKQEEAAASEAIFRDELAAGLPSRRTRM